MTKVIDISDEQIGLNFELVKKANVRGCVIQINEGTDLLDYYPRFINACRAQSLSVGALCISCASDEEEAEEEALTLIKGIEKYAMSDPTLHVWIAFNEDLAEMMDNETLASIANTFIAVCNENEYLAGVRADETTLARLIDGGLTEGAVLWCTTPNADVGRDIDCKANGTETIGAREVDVVDFY